MIVPPGWRLRINVADVSCFALPERRYVGLEPSISQPCILVCDKSSSTKLVVVDALFLLPAARPTLPLLARTRRVVDSIMREDNKAWGGALSTKLTK